MYMAGVQINHIFLDSVTPFKKRTQSWRFALRDILASSTSKTLYNVVLILYLNHHKGFHFIPITLTLLSKGLIQGLKSCREMLKFNGNSINKKNILSQFGRVISSPAMPEKGLENITVEDVLKTKGDEKDRSWISCLSNDTVFDAAKTMAQNNIGSLVVLKPGEQHIAGIITERDYLRKVIAQGRSSKYTRVAEIMTDENKLIAVTSDMNVLQAMQLMTEHHIRHVPVIDGKIVGMISMVDVVRAVVDQQRGELKRLNEFIRGDYY